MKCDCACLVEYIPRSTHQAQLSTIASLWSNNWGSYGRLMVPTQRHVPLLLVRYPAHLGVGVMKGWSQHIFVQVEAIPISCYLWNRYAKFLSGKTVTCCTLSTNIKGCQVVAPLCASCVHSICALQVVGPMVKTNHIYN